MRLFVAVWPSPEARAHLDAELAPLRARYADLRWQPPERWHLTMAFLGEVPDERVDRVRHAVADVAARHPACDGQRLAGSGTFGRLVWTGLDPVPSPLAPAAADLARAMRAVAVSIERRAWHPHVTLGRAREESPSVGGLRADLAGYRGRAWSASEVTLVRSTTGPSPAYTVLERWGMSG